MTESTLHASDLMTRDIIAVSPETPILDVHRLFVEEEIHGAPVVGEDGIVVGVLSSQDLSRIIQETLDPERLQEMTAEDAMTTEIVMLGLGATAREIAQTMLDHRIHRVLVCDDDRALAGVITTFDLLRAVATGATGSSQHTGYAR